MKKLRLLVVTLFCSFVFTPLVFAAGSIKVSTTNVNVVKGRNATFTITANNAAGRVDVVSSSGLIKLSTNSIWLDNNSQAITVTGLSLGSSTITVTLKDVATYDEEVLTGSYTINVNVKEPTAIKPGNNTNTTVPNNTTNPETPNNTVTDSNLQDVLKSATELVVKAEETKTLEDYEKALEAVNSLSTSTEKNELLQRLRKVKDSISTPSEEVETPTSAQNPFIVISILLLVCVVLLVIYIIIDKATDNKKRNGRRKR